MDIDPATPAYLAARVAAILASPAVIVKRAPTPSAEPWPFDVPEPADLAALYAVTDGIELADGTVILRRAELAGTTAWLKQEKSLDDWAEGIFVLGERSDLVIARDLDPAGTRAGGGVLEAPTDGLSTFKRAAFGVVGYLEGRLSPAGDPSPSPEVAARDASARGDAAALAGAIARPFYPGADRDLAHAAQTLGALRSAAGDAEGAMEAFELSVAARLRSVRRGAEESEARAAWRACAVAAERAGATAISSACAARIASPLARPIRTE